MYSMFHYTDCEQLVFTNFVWFHGIPIWNNESRLMYSMFHYTDCEQLVFTNFVWFHGIPIWNNECGYLYRFIFCMGIKASFN